MTATPEVPLTAGSDRSTLGPDGRTNPLAVASLVSVFFLPVAAIVLGHLALGQIARSGEGGRGLAVTALVVSYGAIALLAALVVCCVVFLLLVSAAPLGFAGPAGS